MGFLQNNFMKRMYKHLQGIVQADEFRLAMIPVPDSLLTVSEKTSDNMVIVYTNENVAAYFYFGSVGHGDTFIYGTAINLEGTWDFSKNSAVFTPFSATDTASECLALFIELVTAVSMRNWSEISDDEEENEGLRSLLNDNFGITAEDSYRDITLRVIKVVGEQIPALSVGAKFVY